jgi:hypothetical protein
MAGLVAVRREPAGGGTGTERRMSCAFMINECANIVMEISFLHNYTALVALR